MQLRQIIDDPDFDFSCDDPIIELNERSIEDPFEDCIIIAPSNVKHAYTNSVIENEYIGDPFEDDQAICSLNETDNSFSEDDSNSEEIICVGKNQSLHDLDILLQQHNNPAFVEMCLAPGSAPILISRDKFESIQNIIGPIVPFDVKIRKECEAEISKYCLENPNITLSKNEYDRMINEKYEIKLKEFQQGRQEIHHQRAKQRITKRLIQQKRYEKYMTPDIIENVQKLKSMSLDDGYDFLDDMKNDLQRNMRHLRFCTNELLQNEYIHKYFFDHQIDYVETISELYIFAMNKHKHTHTIDKFVLSDNDLNKLVKILTEIQSDQLDICAMYMQRYILKTVLMNEVYSKNQLREPLYSQAMKNKINSIHAGSKGEHELMKILVDTVEACPGKFFFFYRHRWSFCKFINELEFDFYCIYFHNNTMHQFVIECDGNQHFKLNKRYDPENYNVRDILKQYYLSCMNVHLIRMIDYNIISRNSIADILENISTTHNYICKGAILPYNQNIFLRTYTKQQENIYRFNHHFPPKYDFNNYDESDNIFNIGYGNALIL